MFATCRRTITWFFFANMKVISNSNFCFLETPHKSKFDKISLSCHPFGGHNAFTMLKSLFQYCGVPIQRGYILPVEQISSKDLFLRKTVSTI